MDCAEELTLIQRGLQSTAGVQSLAADFVGRRLHVTFDSQQITAVEIARQISALGFPAEVSLDVVRRPASHLPRLPASTLIAGGLLLVAGGWVWRDGSHSSVAWWLAVLAAGVSGLSVAQAGLRALRLGTVDMNGLMTLAGVGAIATGDSYEAATALLLFNLSLWLEQLSLGRARRAVESLAQLQPRVAHQLTSAGPVDIDTRQIVVGDQLLIKPGERLPVDGVVLSGASSVNQAPLTGESTPIDKQPGDVVYSGTLNGSGSLTVEATHTADASAAATIARLVEQAQATRSPTQRFVDRFARRYTPLVVGLALLVALLTPMWLDVSWHEGLHRGLVLLVIACPCALVISTPVTIVCGLHRAATRGMLIKGGEFLEAAGNITAVAFDKTGTLTLGRPTLGELLTLGSFSAEQVLAWAAAVEEQSQHPWAAAIVTAARGRGLTWTHASAVVVEHGRGVCGEVDGHRVVVGNERLLRERQLSYAPYTAAIVSHTGTAVWIALDEQIVGVLLLVDPLRSDARGAIDDLRRLGIASITILTGDQRTTTLPIAAQLAITDVRAELLPSDKLAAIHDLTARNERLAMIGDGINDAPALAAAPLGIAFGAGASDTALEAADVVIVAPHLTRIVELVQLGRRCHQLLAQNITWALAIKLVTLVAAAGGWATMWMAVAADVGASLVVIFNGMRLLNFRVDWETRV